MAVGIWRRHSKRNTAKPESYLHELRPLHGKPHRNQCLWFWNCAESGVYQRNTHYSDHYTLNIPDNIPYYHSSNHNPHYIPYAHCHTGNLCQVHGKSNGWFRPTLRPVYRHLDRNNHIPLVELRRRRHLISNKPITYLHRDGHLFSHPDCLWSGRFRFGIRNHHGIRRTTSHHQPNSPPTQPLAEHRSPSSSLTSPPGLPMTGTGHSAIRHSHPRGTRSMYTRAQGTIRSHSGSGDSEALIPRRNSSISTSFRHPRG